MFGRFITAVALSLYLFSFFIVRSSYAFDFYYKDFNIDSMMGVNCGMPDTTINKCCKLPRAGDFQLNFSDPKDPFKTPDLLALDAATLTIRTPFTILMNVLGAVIITTVGNVATAISSSASGQGKFAACIDGAYPSPFIDDPSCVCLKNDVVPPLKTEAELCYAIKDSNEVANCLKCANVSAAKNQEPGIWTGIGCIYPNTTAFIKTTVLGTGVSLAGIAALFCIMYSAFQMQLSRGNAEKIKKAQELLTSCIMGLLLIIFSVFILRVIGVDILKIPGFN